jgi:uncharacterized protein (DUF433 family)
MKFTANDGACYLRAMSTVETKYQHLAPNPRSSYRQLFLKGRRIRAWVIYCDHVAQDMTAEEIAADRDLPVEAVREAIAYCASNPPEVRGRPDPRRGPYASGRYVRAGIQVESNAQIAYCSGNRSHQSNTGSEAMRLYLDEDIESRHLVQALRKAAHDVATPMEFGLMGESDTL